MPVQTVDLTCAHCSAIFQRVASYQRHLVDRRGITMAFCSRDCKDASQRAASFSGTAALYLSGESLAEVAQRFGVSADTIRRQLLKQGIPLRRRTAHLSTDRNPTKGKGHTESARAAIRAANQRQFDRPGARELAAHNQRRAMAAGLVPSVSRLEDVVAEQLDALGVGHTRQALLRENGRYCACLDFLLISGEALEVNGTYWHADPRVYPDGPVHASQRRSHVLYERKRAALARLGVPLLEVWELDIEADPAKAVKAALGL